MAGKAKFALLSVFLLLIVLSHILFMYYTRGGLFFGSEWCVYIGLGGVLAWKGCDWLCKE